MLKDVSGKNSENIAIQVLSSSTSLFDEPELQEFEELLKRHFREEERRKQVFKENVAPRLREILSTTYYTEVDTAVGRIYIAFRGGTAWLRMLSMDDEQTFKQKYYARFHDYPIWEADPPEKLIQLVQATVSTHVPYAGKIDTQTFTKEEYDLFCYCQTIPAGQKRTYEDVAIALGAKYTLEEM
jgi:hypothetical protein